MSCRRSCTRVSGTFGCGTSSLMNAQFLLLSVLVSSRRLWEQILRFLGAFIRLLYLRGDELFISYRAATPYLKAPNYRSPRFRYPAPTPGNAPCSGSTSAPAG